MLSFKEWLHETEMNEGWQDWGKKAALGGALLSAGMGISRLANTGDDNIPSSSVTYPAAKQFVQQQKQRLDTIKQNQDGTYSITVMKRGGVLSKFDEERLTKNKADMILATKIKGRSSIVNKQDNGKTITFTYKIDNTPTSTLIPNY